MKQALYILLLLFFCGKSDNLCGQKDYQFMDESTARMVLSHTNVSIDSQILARLSLEQATEQLDLDSSLLLIDEALRLIQQHDRPRFASTVHRLHGNLLFYKRQYPAAILAYKQAGDLDRNRQEYLIAAYNEMAIGKSFMFMGTFDSAAHYYLDRAQPLVQQYGTAHDQASLFSYIAEYYMSIGDMPSTEHYTDSLMAAAKASQESGRLAEAYDQKGILRYYQLDFAGAIKWMSKAHPILDSLNYIGFLIANENGQATIFAEVGMIDSAITYFLTALKRAEDKKNPGDIGFITSQIANLYQALGNQAESNRLRKEALKVLDQLDQLSRWATLLSMLGAVIENQDQQGYQEVMRHIEEQQASFQSSENLMLRYLMAAADYQFDQNYARALEEFLAVQQAPDSIIRKFQIVDLDLYLAKCYLALKQPQRALSVIEKAEKKLEMNPYFLAKRKVLLLALKTHLQLEQFDAADAYETRYEAALQEEMSTRHIIALQMAQTHYQTDKISAERDVNAKEARLAQQAQRQTLIITVIVSLVLVLVAVFSFFLFRANQRQRRLTREVARQRDRNETLLGELNHRVKNNLQRLSNLLKLQELQTNEGEAKEALIAGSRRIEAMSLLHRRIYEGQDIGKLNLKDYLTLLTHNLLPAYGFPLAQVELHLQLADLDIDVDSGVSIALIANEWITNAIKYALPQTPYLAVSLDMLDPNVARLRIADHGPGLPASFAQEQADSYGLQLVNMMAEQLYGEIILHRETGTQWELRFTVKR